MVLFLIIAACVWFGLGTIFVLSLVRAARCRMPAPPELASRNLTVIAATDSAQSQQLVSTESGDFIPAQDTIQELVTDKVAS